MCREKRVMGKGEDVEKSGSASTSPPIILFTIFSAFLFLFCVPCLGDA